MACEKCGRPSAIGANFCRYCGNPLTNPYQPSVTKPTGPPLNFEMPNNYLIESILATLCCCIPLGIVAIVFAARVDSAWAKGNFHEAIQASKQARMWCLLSYFAGILVVILSAVVNATLVTRL